jgi:hypothetical protein
VAGMVRPPNPVCGFDLPVIISCRYCISISRLYLIIA